MNNYAFETSLPACKSHLDDKKRQSETILEAIRRGANNIRQVSEMTKLESGRISARISDLMKAGDIRYDGKVKYDNMTRKRIVVNVPIISHNITTQPLIF
jgi:predicted transcriptional regulator